MSIAPIEVGHRTPRRVSVQVALAWVLLLGGAGPVRAAPAVKDARELYAAGLQSYRAGDYEDAIAKLKASYQLVPAPGLLYDLAQAHRLKGDCANARALYRQFLDQAPEGPVEPLARSRLAEMDTCLALTAVVALAGGAMAPARTTSPAETSRAAPAPVAAPLATERLPGAGAEVDRASGPSARAHEVASAAHRSRFAGRRTALTAGLAALGFAGASAYFAWRADRMSDQVSGMFLPGQQWGAAGMSAEASGRSSETLGVLTAVGALLCGGLAVWLAKRD